MFDPEKRTAVDQDIAHRPTGKGADEGHRENADDIHLLARRLDQARHGEGDRRSRTVGRLFRAKALAVIMAYAQLQEKEVQEDELKAQEKTNDE